VNAGLDRWRKERREARKAEAEIVAGNTIGEIVSGNTIDQTKSNSTNTVDKRVHLRPWQPGQSGNPAGRPAIPPEVLEILKAASPAAARRLVELVDSPEPAVALKAIDMLQNRIYGRPAQTLDAKIETTNVQQAHLQVLLELQAKRDDAMKTIEGTTGDKPEEGA
jgi:hypothetical protein